MMMGTLYLRLLKFILVIKIFLSSLDILLLFLTRPDKSGRMPFPIGRRVSADLGYFFVANLLVYAGIRWLNKTNRVRVDAMVGPAIRDFDRLFRWAMAAVFVWSGLVKFCYPGLDARFFTFSGYSGGFLVAIAIVEIGGGSLLLAKRTAAYGAMILIVDMAGAIYTHFHNYVLRDAPHPFLNSLPAISLLPFLIAIVVIARERTDQKLWYI